jgi:hypothetical protein
MMRRPYGLRKPELVFAHPTHLPPKSPLKGTVIQGCNQAMPRCTTHFAGSVR